jgi:phosphoribosylformylglycinamidine synthase
MVSDLGQSLWLSEIVGRKDGSPPTVDLGLERKVGEFVRELIQNGEVTAVHDVSDGGLAVAIAEMALAGNVGASFAIEVFGTLALELFAEDQARYLITAADGERLMELATQAAVNAVWIGTTGGADLVVSLPSSKEIARVSLSDLRAAHEGFFPALMQGELGAG